MAILALTSGWGEESMMKAVGWGPWGAAQSMSSVANRPGKYLDFVRRNVRACWRARRASWGLAPLRDRASSGPLSYPLSCNPAPFAQLSVRAYYSPLGER